MIARDSTAAAIVSVFGNCSIIRRDGTADHADFGKCYRRGIAEVLVSRGQTTTKTPHRCRRGRANASDYGRSCRPNTVRLLRIKRCGKIFRRRRAMAAEQ